MSFSSDTKKELCSIDELPSCCLHALSYGLLLYSKAFSAGAVSLSIENPDVAELYAKYIKQIIHKEPVIHKSSSGKYSITIDSKEYRLKILSHFGYSGTEIAIRLNRANLADDCCAGSFIRGAFLACGTVTEPEKNYHLEFVSSRINISRDLIKLFNEYDIYPKNIMRKNSFVIYFKDSESIEDILTFLGAGNSSLKLMGIKMHKDMRNNINRKINFDTANITRQVDASSQQIHAIEKIRESIGFEALSEDLREIASLRLENPEMSLRELGEQLKEPVSRSGVYHRLKRLIKISEEI